MKISTNRVLLAAIISTFTIFVFVVIFSFSTMNESISKVTSSYKEYEVTSEMKEQIQYRLESGNFPNPEIRSLIHSGFASERSTLDLLESIQGFNKVLMAAFTFFLALLAILCSIYARKYCKA